MFKTHPVDLYDFVYSWKNYAQESQTIRAFAGEFGFQPGQTVLELACGTGRYLEHFSDCKQIGIDLCERSLQLAKQRTPNGVFFQADMVNFHLSEQVDVILSLFGAFGYLLTNDQKITAIQAMANNLRPGGLLVLQPWLEPADFHVGQTYLQTYESPNMMVSRMVTTQLKGDVSVLEFHFLVSRSGFKTEYLKCMDQLKMSQHSELLTDLKLNGFEFLSKKQFPFSDRPLFVLRKSNI